MPARLTVTVPLLSMDQPSEEPLLSVTERPSVSMAAPRLATSPLADSLLVAVMSRSPLTRMVVPSVRFQMPNALPPLLLTFISVFAAVTEMPFFPSFFMPRTKPLPLPSKVSCRSDASTWMGRSGKALA